MKKKILIISLAILIGCFLAFFTLVRMNHKEIKTELLSLTVLQTGVFSNYQNALAKKNTFENAIIYQNNGEYLVLVGASTNESGLIKIESILKQKKIYFYKKTIQVLKKDIELIKKYNMLLERAENDETVLLLNQKILEKINEV